MLLKIFITCLFLFMETVLFFSPAWAQLRDFTVTLPLFSSDSPWNQKITNASVVAENDQQILTLYRVLRGDTTGFQPPTTTPVATWPFIDINYDAYSVPIFAMGSGVQQVTVKDYDGNLSENNSKLPTGQDGKIQVPTTAGNIRPAGPQDTDADGHMVLFNTQTNEAYDFWQVTTARDASGNSLGGGQTGAAILAMGAVDYFDTSTTGVNTDGASSARATGVPLLAGLILPEDIESGSIDHALSFAIPFPRNLNTQDPFTPFSTDYFSPASTTETDYYSTNPKALAAGQTVRLKQTLVDENGQSIDETGLSPITLMFLTALRTYGGIVVDNAGGFSFYAEDIHTGNLRLTDDQVNQLIGSPTGTPIPTGKTKWQWVLEALSLELEQIPMAYGPWTSGQDPAVATITTSNYEIVSRASSPDDTDTRLLALKAAKTWMYQIQGLDESGAIAALAATDYPVLVLEPGHNFNDGTVYDTDTMITTLRNTPDNQRRLLLAYIDIGQAEDYRTYWQSSWVAPTATQIGSPDFLVTVDPDGWSGNYPVAYWRTEWKNIWTGSSGIIAQLANCGFDGIYLDWVEAYDDEKIMAVAENEGVDAAVEMIKFIEELRQAGQSVSPGFLVVPQNAPYLIDKDTNRYAAAIDALAVEDTWYHGAGDANWDDPDAGDLHDRHDGQWSTAARLSQYQKYQTLGLPVFSVDYCISQANADYVYSQANAAGLIPLVTRVSLSKLTVTPPTGQSSSTGGFDYQAYLAANPDLPATWGKAEAMNHYIQYGFSEKRAVGFNVNEYLSANADFPANWSYAEALNHYNMFGKFEDRLLAFDAKEYTGLYGDLPDNWTHQEALNHFLAFGKAEGRIASFDAVAYLEMYTDLPASWGKAEAFYHYVYFGQSEGRVYDPYDEAVFGAAD